MAIADDFAIDYVNKIVNYIGGFTDSIPDSVYTANALYTFLQDTFDEPNQMDDLVPMEGKTPVNYEMINRWFVDPTSVKALSGGAIATNGWTFSATVDADGDYGITELDYSSDGAPTQGNDGYTDKGVVLTGGTSGATGEILWADNANDKVWVRNTSSTQFDDATPELVTGTGWSFTLNTTALGGVESGEQLWTNVYTIGTQKPDTDLYVYQDNPADVATKLTSWWADGAIDVLILVAEHGVAIDSGLVTVMARQFGTLYDHFTADLSPGGRQPAPLATAVDLNNSNGYRRTLIPGAFSGTFEVGEVITGGTSNAKAILTAFVTDTSLDYYLVGKNLTDFQTPAEVITGEDSSATATKDTNPPSNINSALLSDVTIVFGANVLDLNNGNGSRKYSILIDPSDNPLDEVYERLKYVTRRGAAAGDLGPAGGSYLENGEAYIGSEVRLDISQGATVFDEGDLVTQTGGTGAGSTGVCVAFHDDGTTGQLILNQVRGTFSTDATSVDDEGTGTATVTAVTGIAPVKPAPFGTFAGGIYFGAPGVALVIANLAAGDEQAYQLIDDLGVTQTPPNRVTVQVTGLETGDRAAIFRLAGVGQPIEKDRYTGTVQSVGATTIVVAEAITSDEPDIAGDNYLRVVDTSDPNDREARLRYGTWATSTFTLETDGGAGTATTGDATGTTLIDTAADFGGADDVRVGDVVLNTTDNSWGVVISIDSTTQLTHTTLVDGSENDWDVADAYQINQLPFATTTSDTVYVPLVDEVMTGAGSASNTLIYNADIPVTVRVRQKGIKPFTQITTVDSGGLSTAAIRNPDEVVS
jgi:hypothetical protein